jgi:hypothetical protein
MRRRMNPNTDERYCPKCKGNNIQTDWAGNGEPLAYYCQDCDWEAWKAPPFRPKPSSSALQGESQKELKE